MDEESILRALTRNGDGILLNLDGLSQCGKIFLYSCIHLLQKPPNLKVQQHNNIFETYKFLSESKNIGVQKLEVLDILGNFVDSKGSLIHNKKKRAIANINQHIESNNDSNQSKKPKVEEVDWLAAYKNQCEKGRHTWAQMADILGTYDTTLKSRVKRYK